MRIEIYTEEYSIHGLGYTEWGKHRVRYIQSWE